ncbi:hypothetical protein [Parasitella parasitica]|uniref:Putative transcription factor kapC n=1 Tax=Parasitella parasitica TaxID=35722 RepID=A0A0B7NPD2_9FUNG|nr:hypothetical protein [Parasitella parasitica]
MNSNNSSNHSSQPWMIPADHAPETFDYMISRPPGSVLPLPPQHQHQHSHQQQPQHQQQQSLTLQRPAPHSPNHQEQSISPPAQLHEYESSKNSKGGSRAVIPSKRAAQNRAAQKAFRQRREQYIKDLEIKAKEMEDWQEEMDKLRRENGELRQRVATLEHHVVVLSEGDASKLAELERLKASDTHTTTLSTSPPIAESDTMTRKSSERSMSLPIVQVGENEALAERGNPPPSNLILSTSVKRSHQDSRLRYDQQTLDSPNNDNLHNNNALDKAGSFTRIPPYHLKDHKSALIGNDTTAALQQVDDANKRHKSDDSVVSQRQQSRQSIDQTSISNISTSFASDSPAIANPMIQINTDNSLLVNVQRQQHEQPQLQYSTNDFWSKNGSNPNAMMPPPPGIGNFDLDFDFDPFFEDEFGPTFTSNNDFVPNANSGQVLDDLFAMLQTRQRPQIPMVPSEENAADLSTNNNNGANNFNECLG